MFLRVYKPRIWYSKSPSRVCKLKENTVDNRQYSDTENTIRLNGIDVYITMTEKQH